MLCYHKCFSSLTLFPDLYCFEHVIPIEICLIDICLFLNFCIRQCLRVWLVHNVCLLHDWIVCLVVFPGMFMLGFCAHYHNVLCLKVVDKLFCVLPF